MIELVDQFGKPFSAEKIPRVTFPPWMDALWMLQASHLETRTVQSVAPGGNAAVPGNSQRWAIGFKHGSGVIAAMAVTPIQSAEAFMWDILGRSEPRWFTIFEFGPMVPMEWYVIGTPGIDVMVFELLIQR